MKQRVWGYVGRRITVWGLVTALGAVFVLQVGGIAYAYISSTYEAAEGIKQGSILQLKSADSRSVEPADNSKDHKPIGIAVTDTTDTAIKVAVEGELNVLVSLENGEIKKGDAVMVSTIPGVGMKAGREGIIVGTATGNFLTTTPITTTFSLDAQEVKVGVVPIAIDIKTKVLQNKSYIPGLNANTPTKAAISILVIAFAVIMIVTLVYSAVKNSLLAVGRNPLTSGVISKHLVMVLLFAVGLLVVTLVTIFVLNR